MKDFRFVDLFCGGGGSITGEISALKRAGVKYEGRGFNHWELAIKTIQANHPEIVPDFERACAPIESILPDEIFAEDPERIDVLWASPACTNHSVAKGGKPRSNQSRCQPEYLLPYLRLTKCRRMYVENVVELRKWGPVLDKDIAYKGKKYKAGQPDPRYISRYFNDWIRDIKHSGYEVEYQVMNSADYGAATSRERLIIQAVRKSFGEKIIWPEPTHTREPGLLSGTYKPWRSAAEIIDWTIPGKSIFDREKPLCENTLRRIKAGIRKYWGEWADPFIAMIDGENQTFTVPLSAFPQTFMTRYNGGENRNHAVSDPMPVIDCGNRYGLISPLFIPQQSAGAVKPCAGNPVSTIATSGAIGIIQPFLSAYYTPGTTTGVNNPVPCITTKDRFDLVMPFLVEYYGNGVTHPVTEPVPVITTHDRFGLVQGRILTLPDGQRFKLDITHRMLTAKELAAATGFPEDYIFAGSTSDAKKMIGNAVTPPLAEALFLSALSA